jgi:hypothetical protein
VDSVEALTGSAAVKEERAPESWMAWRIPYHKFPSTGPGGCRAEIGIDLDERNRSVQAKFFKCLHAV